MARVTQSSVMRGNYRTVVRNNYPHRKVTMKVNRRTRIRVRRVWV